MKSSNPYMSSLTKATAESQRAQAMAHQGGYSQPGYAQNPYATQAQPGYQQSPNYGVPTKAPPRPMAVGDLGPKPGLPQAVIVVFA
ncbi:MAG: hypothetical protein L0L26_12480, partial [Corynebacterium variabile]|nr:hypothetical protein [Corynebacterium variabile]